MKTNELLLLFSNVWCKAILVDTILFICWDLCCIELIVFNEKIIINVLL